MLKPFELQITEILIMLNLKHRRYENTESYRSPGRYTNWLKKRVWLEEKQPLQNIQRKEYKQKLDSLLRIESQNEIDNYLSYS